ncbi:MAG: hypothetical protein ACE5EC_10015 [Phycisphaerae bacterium]
MLKRSKGFVFGIITTVAVIFAAVHFGFVKIDLTVTEKGQAALDQGSTLIDTAVDETTGLFNETETTD